MVELVGGEVGEDGGGDDVVDGEVIFYSVADEGGGDVGDDLGGGG